MWGRGWWEYFLRAAVLWDAVFWSDCRIKWLFYMPGRSILLLRVLGGLFSALACVLRDDSIPSALETGQKSVNQQVFIKHSRVHCPLEAWSGCSFCTFLWAILFLTRLSLGNFSILNANVYGLKAYLSVPRVGWVETSIAFLSHIFYREPVKDRKNCLRKHMEI